MTRDDAREWNDPTSVDEPASAPSGSGDVRLGVVVLGAWSLAYAGFLAYVGEHGLAVSSLAIAVLLYLGISLVNVAAVWLAVLARDL